MKTIIISTKHNWVEKILNGEKTVEVRKTAPKEVPFKVLIYCTLPKGKKIANDCVQGDFLGTIHHLDGRPVEFVMTRNECGMVNGKVVGEFICEKVEVFDSAWSEYAEMVAPVDIPCTMPMNAGTAYQIMKENGKMTDKDIDDYFGDEDYKACFMHITSPRLYDRPKELSEFRKPLSSVYCTEHKKRGCDENCVAFGDSDYYCKEQDIWSCGLKRAPQSWQYVEEIK